MEKYVQLSNGVFLSDRFVGGYDPKVCDFYVEDKYVNHRYFRESDEYHMALITLLNDRQGYINFIIDLDALIIPSEPYPYISISLLSFKLK